MAQKMQKWAQDMLDLYDNRLKKVEALRKKSTQLLENLKKQQEELSIQLREFLAKDRSLRRKDFETVISGIRIRQKEREDEVEEELKRFREEMNERKNKLEKILTRGESLRIKDFKTTIADIQVYQKKREGEIKKLLKDFQKEREDLNTQLKDLWAKGESLRIRDFKVMIKGIQDRQRERKDEVDELLRNLVRERENLKKEAMKALNEVRMEQKKIREEWKELTSAIQKR